MYLVLFKSTTSYRTFLPTELVSLEDEESARTQGVLDVDRRRKERRTHNTFASPPKSSRPFSGLVEYRTYVSNRTYCCHLCVQQEGSVLHPTPFDSEQEQFVNHVLQYLPPGN